MNEPLRDFKGWRGVGKYRAKQLKHSHYSLIRILQFRDPMAILQEFSHLDVIHIFTSEDIDHMTFSIYTIFSLGTI